MAREVRVNVVGDSRSLERTFQKSSRATKEFAGNLGAVDRGLARVGAGRAAFIGGFAGAGAAIIAPKVLQQINQSISAASNLNEQITKSQAVFGASSGAILSWSKTTATAMGISQRAALEAAGTFGNLFSAVGIAGPEAERFSEQLVQLAADLASFNNANVDDVLLAIRSGLVGEAEPLRRYGVLLSEARVQQLALAQSGKDNVKALTNQEKAQARLSIIFKDTAKAQGDFARTSGGLANTQRRLAAQSENLQASLGRLLLPAVTEITDSLATAAAGAVALTEKLGALGDIRIPDIELPFNVTIGGSSLSDGAFGIGWSDSLIDVIARAFDDGVTPRTAELANRFGRTIDTLTQNALDTALGNAKPPTPKTKGFGTGLTPADLFGPLVKEIPAALQESLLDAQIAGDPRQIRAVLQRILTVMENALDDPRLKRPGRIQIKKLIDSIKGQIAAQDSAIAQAGKDAASKRQAAIDKASQAAKDAAAKQRAGFDELLANLRIQIDDAAATRGFADDLRRNTQLQNAIKAQIKVEGRTAELVGMLADARRDRSAILASRLQARQFGALGLTDAGDALIPGVNNLRKQLSQLTSRLVDEGEMTPKIRSQLSRIGKVLSGAFGDVTDDTRQKVRDMFRDIRQVFGEETNKGLGGPDLRRVTLSDKILAALGFGRDPDAMRLTNLGGAVRTLSASTGAVPRQSFGNAAASGGVTITGPITVVADNPDAFLRELQKKAGRTSATARGRSPGRSLGLG